MGKNANSLLLRTFFFSVLRAEKNTLFMSMPSVRLWNLNMYQNFKTHSTKFYRRKKKRSLSAEVIKQIVCAVFIFLSLSLQPALENCESKWTHKRSRKNHAVPNKSSDSTWFVSAIFACLFRLLCSRIGINSYETLSGVGTIPKWIAHHDHLDSTCAKCGFLVEPMNFANCPGVICLQSKMFHVQPKCFMFILMKSRHIEKAPLVKWFDEEHSLVYAFH